MRRKKEVLAENGEIQMNSKKANELQAIFSSELANFHKAGRGQNRRITQILPVAANETVDFLVYERILSDDPLIDPKNELKESVNFLNYIFMIGGVPKWGRKMALQGLNTFGGAEVAGKGEKSLYELFTTEGYTSVTLFYSDGIIKALARTVDNQSIAIDLIEKLNSFLEENGV